jgi:hypothetical protein
MIAIGPGFAALYGGFETLSMPLIPVGAGIAHEVFVFSSTPVYPCGRT